MSSNEALQAPVPAAEEAVTSIAFPTAPNEAGFTYQRADGTVEQARDAQDAIARCPVLGKLALEAPDQATALLELAAAGKAKMAADTKSQPEASAQTETSAGGTPGIEQIPKPSVKPTSEPINNFASSALAPEVKTIEPPNTLEPVGMTTTQAKRLKYVQHPAAINNAIHAPHLDTSEVMPIIRDVEETPPIPMSGKAVQKAIAEDKRALDRTPKTPAPHTLSATESNIPDAEARSPILDPVSISVEINKRLALPNIKDQESESEAPIAAPTDAPKTLVDTAEDASDILTVDAHATFDTLFAEVHCAGFPAQPSTEYWIGSADTTLAPSADIENTATEHLPELSMYAQKEPLPLTEEVFVETSAAPENIEGAPAIPAPVDVLERKITEVAERIEELKDIELVDVHMLLDRISKKATEAKNGSDHKTTGVKAHGTTEEIKDEVCALFAELLDDIDVGYSEEILASLIELALTNDLPDLINETGNSDDPTAHDRGTHEIIKQLLAGIGKVKKTVVHVYYLGRSAMQLYHLQPAR
jgi:hypothetical protein